MIKFFHGNEAPEPVIFRFVELLDKVSKLILKVYIR